MATLPLKASRNEQRWLRSLWTN